MVAQVKTIAPHLSEHDIQGLILDWLLLNKYYAWRNNSGAVVSEYKGKKRFMRYGKVGSSDILGVLTVKDLGVMLCIEVKLPKNKPTPEQIEFINTINKKGGLAFVTHSLEETIEIIRNHEKKLLTMYYGI